MSGQKLRNLDFLGIIWGPTSTVTDGHWQANRFCHLIGELNCLSNQFYRCQNSTGDEELESSVFGNSCCLLSKARFNDRQIIFLYICKAPIRMRIRLMAPIIFISVSTALYYKKNIRIHASYKRRNQVFKIFIFTASAPTRFCLQTSCLLSLNTSFLTS
jgi:hypothetical protein